MEGMEPVLPGLKATPAYSPELIRAQHFKRLAGETADSVPSHLCLCATSGK